MNPWTGGGRRRRMCADGRVQKSPIPNGPPPAPKFFYSAANFFGAHEAPEKKSDFTKKLRRKKPFLRTAKKSSVPWLGGCGCCGWVVVAAVAGWLWPLWLGGCGRCGWVVVAAVAGWWWLLCGWVVVAAVAAVAAVWWNTAGGQKIQNLCANGPLYIL